MQPLKLMWQVTSGAQGPSIKSVPESVKREALEKNADVNFLMLDASVPHQTQQVKLSDRKSIM